ncbi:MAG: hypothetical protein K5863_09035 [Nitratireductor sp.]|uniref:hypothetical protein n=1 Tax=Nitratireductor sp. TaxID=1872084 RepID=UPI002628E1C3|nr:hypothetical protein [Nitratireductor sp.]MCV0350208.1 hypothetical protein [Nitratireductor sp.]
MNKSIDTGGRLAPPAHVAGGTAELCPDENLLNRANEIDRSSGATGEVRPDENLLN